MQYLQSKQNIHTNFFIAVIILATLAFSAFFIPTSSQAKGFLLRDTHQCSAYFARYERKFDIPQGLLKAISTKESGRWTRKKNGKIPWPWAVNVSGRGYYLESYNGALKKMKRLAASGKTNFDVGCMQINYRYHSKAFRNLEQMLDPKYNIAYAAKFLRKHYERTGSWDKAVGDYHSGYVKRGKRYADNVLAIWKQDLGETMQIASLGSEKVYIPRIYPPRPVVKSSLY